MLAKFLNSKAPELMDGIFQFFKKSYNSKKKHVGIKKERIGFISNVSVIVPSSTFLYFILFVF